MTHGHMLMHVGDCGPVLYWMLAWECAIMDTVDMYEEMFCMEQNCKLLTNIKQRGGGGCVLQAHRNK